MLLYEGAWSTDNAADVCGFLCREEGVSFDDIGSLLGCEVICLRARGKRAVLGSGVMQLPRWGACDERGKTERDDAEGEGAYCT